MRASGVLSWFVNELFPVFGTVLGILASFGAASFEQFNYTVHIHNNHLPHISLMTLNTTIKGTQKQKTMAAVAKTVQTSSIQPVTVTP